MNNGKGKGHSATGHKGSEREWRYSSILSLTSALDGCGWLTPHPGRFPPAKVTQYKLHVRPGGPGAGLKRCGKSCPHQYSIPGPSNPQQVALPTELSRLGITVSPRC
jgi:hypothetical protein